MLCFREPSDELVSQCKSLMHEQKLAGKSFEEAYKSIRDVHGVKALTGEKAHEIWAREYGEFGHVISNCYELGTDKCMTMFDWLHTAKRVIDGRYIFCQAQQELAIILIDLFHEKMMT